jgi:hypothetical protein
MINFIVAWIAPDHTGTLLVWRHFTRWNDEAAEFARNLKLNGVNNSEVSIYRCEGIS